MAAAEEEAINNEEQSWAFERFAGIQLVLKLIVDICNGFFIHELSFSLLLTSGSDDSCSREFL